MFKLRTYSEFRTGKTGSSIADNAVNQPFYSLHVPGKASTDFAKTFAENTIWMSENFAYTSPPERPTIGQLWFDTSTSKLKSFNGETWSEVYGYVEPLSDILPFYDDLTIGNEIYFHNNTYVDSVYLDTLTLDNTIEYNAPLVFNKDGYLGVSTNTGTYTDSSDMKNLYPINDTTYTLNKSLSLLGHIINNTSSARRSWSYPTIARKSIYQDIYVTKHNSVWYCKYDSGANPIRVLSTKPVDFQLIIDIGKITDTGTFYGVNISFPTNITLNFINGVPDIFDSNPSIISNQSKRTVHILSFYTTYNGGIDTGIFDVIHSSMEYEV